MTDRLAPGSLPWPEPPASAQARPVCRGSNTVEAPIAPGARLRITAWPRHHLPQATRMSGSEAAARERRRSDCPF